MWPFWSLKLCLHDVEGQSLHWSIILQGQVFIGSWICGANWPCQFIEPSYIAPHFYGVIQTLYHKIKEQCRLCSANHGDIVLGTEKSRIRETATLSTDADSRTNTNFKNLRNFVFLFFLFFFPFFLPPPFPPSLPLFFLFFSFS